MSADVCMKHQQADPCRLCDIEAILEWTQSRNGTPEQDDDVIKNIQDICIKTLGLKEGEVCDECGNTIPDSAASMQNEHHKESCSLYAAKEEKDYHVVLKRVYNVVVEKVTATSETEAIKAAEKRCDTLSKSLSGIVIAPGVFLDDGDQPTAAMVDSLDKDGNYDEESYFEFDHRGEYVKKD